MKKPKASANNLGLTSIGNVENHYPVTRRFSLETTVGCEHLCRYCVCPYRVAQPLIFSRERFLNRLDSIISRKGFIFLSMRSDPYQDIQEVKKLTREALVILSEKRISLPTHISTKGGMRAADDFSLIQKIPQVVFQTTLAFTSEQHAAFWEPGAASVESRLKAVMEARKKWIPTSIALLPVIYQDQALEVARDLRKYISVACIWGRPQSSPVDTPPPQMDWNEFGYRLSEVFAGASRRIPVIESFRDCFVARGNPLTHQGNGESYSTRWKSMGKTPGFPGRR